MGRRFHRFTQIKELKSAFICVNQRPIHLGFNFSDSLLGYFNHSLP